MADNFLYPEGKRRVANTTSMAPQFNHPDGRLGVPTDKLGIYWFAIMTEEKRQAVIALIIPPEELRDAPRELIREFFRQRAVSVAEGLADEVYKSYTSDPADAAGTQNVADILATHARTLRKG